MNILLQKGLLAMFLAGFRVIGMGMFAMLLASCGGDSGIDIGSGQSADPVVVEYPVFYIKKPLPRDDAGNPRDSDLRELLPAEFGADLYMRERASSGAPEVNLTAAITGGFGDVRDVSINHDATKVLFSLRAPIDPDANDDDQPSWNIWEYDIAAGGLRRILTDSITAEEGHDIGAQYLPDGRIVFSSTRQNQSVAGLTDQGRPQFAALDEDRNEPAFVLHVMNEDGTDLEQISFNQSHDLYPGVLQNGRIIFSRWDGWASDEGISLYTANPDGTDLQLLYGADSHATGTTDSASGVTAAIQFVKARELDDGRILALVQPFTGTYGGGDLVIIDTNNFVNNEQPLVNSSFVTGPAQQPATSQLVSTLPGLSLGGRFAAAWPLRDGTNRALVSWSLCRLRSLPPDFDPGISALPPLQPCSEENSADPLAVAAEPAYGLWMADLSTGDLRPILLPENGYAITDVVVARNSGRPEALVDIDRSGLADPLLLDEKAGVLHIRSVYDFNGADRFGYAELADPARSGGNLRPRPARFVRIYKAVGIPDDDVRDFDISAFGTTRRFGMREIIGYAMVEPDGSVMVKVPADVPLTLDVLDENGRSIFPRHRNWMQVRPGEIRECGGCHDPNLEGVSHGRSETYSAVNTGAPTSGYSFPNTLFPTSADAGETMAQLRARYSCFSDCAAWELSADINYADLWTDPDVRSPDASFSFSYADIAIATDPPQIDGCIPWTVKCRVIINYAEHIQPLWEVSRAAIDPDPMALVNSCDDCHALRDANGILIDPDSGRGQLELTRLPSTQDPDHFKSYRELLSADVVETIAGDQIARYLEFQGTLDQDGNEVLEPVAIGSRLVAGRANLRPEFFTRFTEPGTHQGWLSPAELRLISEWLDIGAQYFNDPFNENVPVN